MILSQVGASSEEFRAVLTSPFLLKKVTINSYDSFNKPQESDETFSRGDFPSIKSTYSPRLHVKDYNVGVINFSKASAGIVKEMIQDGYSVDCALDTQKAIRAYGLNAINTAGGVATISNNVYEV